MYHLDIGAAVIPLPLVQRGISLCPHPFLTSCESPRPLSMNQHNVQGNFTEFGIVYYDRVTSMRLSWQLHVLIRTAASLTAAVWVLLLSSCRYIIQN